MSKFMYFPLPVITLPSNSKTMSNCCSHKWAELLTGDAIEMGRRRNR